MRFRTGPWHQVLLLVNATCVLSASSWGFTDATVSIQGKGSGVGGTFKEKLEEHKVLSKEVALGASDTLKIILTTQDDKIAKRPHQAFLLLKVNDSGLDISYPFSVKENGKAKVELTQKDLPTQLLRSINPIEANLVLGSFGTSNGYNGKAFSLGVKLDANVPVPSPEKPLRYGKLPEIHHLFKADPKSPNIVITLFFIAAVLATLPTLFGVWLYLGANLNHVSKAAHDAPISHSLFYGSIVGLEAIFFMYYTSWNLFKTLPVLFVIGIVTFLSGSRALSEVQERRLAGLR